MLIVDQKIVSEPLRLKRAISQRKLADATGMSQREIIEFETDKRERHPSTLGELANALGVESSALLKIEPYR